MESKLTNARITMLADFDLVIPEWYEGDTPQHQLDEWIKSAQEEPIEAQRCVNARYVIVGYIKDEVKK